MCCYTKRHHSWWSSGGRTSPATINNQQPQYLSMIMTISFSCNRFKKHRSCRWFIVFCIPYKKIRSTPYANQFESRRINTSKNWKWLPQLWLCVTPLRALERSIIHIKNPRLWWDLNLQRFGTTDCRVRSLLSAHSYTHRLRLQV